MKRVLVTGATGNIGKEVIYYLCKQTEIQEIIVASRNVDAAKNCFSNNKKLTFIWFDFEDKQSYNQAFSLVDCMFLLRPPQIVAIKKIFKPLLNCAYKSGVKQILFLSVQGVESSSIIPHFKIEKLIKAIGFQYIFLRPGYFMQNLTTTLQPEIKMKHSITLPAGKAKFNWIDVKNIGEVVAILLTKFSCYNNSALDLTGAESKNFKEVCKIMSAVTGISISFNSVNPFWFYFKTLKSSKSKSYALVLTMLHFLPRLQKQPKISENYFKITGKKPTTLEAFVKREQAALLK